MKELKIDMNEASDKAIKLYLQLKEELALGDNPIPPLSYPEEELPEPPLPEGKDEKTSDEDFTVG